MKFKPNKIALAVFGCIGLYSPAAFAADIWNVEILNDGSYTTLASNTAIAKVNTPTSSNTNSTNYICLHKNDGNLGFESNGKDLIIKRKVDANGVVINSNLAAAVCSDGIAEGLNNANCADSTANGQLYYQMTAKTQLGTSCDSLSGGSFNFSVSESADCSATDNYSFANNTITYTGPELTTTAEKTVYLCGNDLNTGDRAHQAISFTVAGQSGGNTGGPGTLIGGRYYKVDANGNKFNGTEAAVIARTDHACVIDTQKNVTWEVKQPEMNFNPNNLASYHVNTDQFTWYNGSIGSPGIATTQCNYKSYINDNCNTQAFVTVVNREGWCGLSNWKLPSPTQLLDLKTESGTAPYIIGKPFNLFPNTQNDDYYSDELAGYEAKAVTFAYPGKYADAVTTQYYRKVRLISE
ncbi:MAG: hypothetical protein CSA45_01450 [Gammaproteobacteria bacterium]|nr:MAG: hypothetical protein CSA45_01450 [Gammaproteobacteria bacterium]